MVPGNSDDSGSVQNRGEYDGITPGQMVKPFDDFVFNKPIGSLGIVETEFGFHIIKVTDKQDAIRLATVAQKIEASEATSNDIFTKATKFEMDASKKDFNTVAKAMGLSVQPSANVKALDDSYGMFQNQRSDERSAFYKKNS